VLIGVTGHRDLRSEDEPALRAAVGGVLDGIARELPHSPLRLLTPLAEGSDRLVAEEALARGFGLIVPLLMQRGCIGFRPARQSWVTLLAGFDVLELLVHPTDLGRDPRDPTRQCCRDRQRGECCERAEP